MPPARPGNNYQGRNYDPTKDRTSSQYIPPHERGRPQRSWRPREDGAPRQPSVQLQGAPGRETRDGPGRRTFNPAPAGGGPPVQHLQGSSYPAQPRVPRQRPLRGPPGQQEDRPYGQPYGQPYRQSYGQPRGQPRGQQYVSQPGSAYPPQYPVQYGPQRGRAYPPRSAAAPGQRGDPPWSRGSPQDRPTYGGYDPPPRPDGRGRRRGGAGEEALCDGLYQSTGVYSSSVGVSACGSTGGPGAQGYGLSGEGAARSEVYSAVISFDGSIQLSLADPKAAGQVLPLPPISVSAGGMNTYPTSCRVVDRFLLFTTNMGLYAVDLRRRREAATQGVSESAQPTGLSRSQAGPGAGQRRDRDFVGVASCPSGSSAGAANVGAEYGEYGECGEIGQGVSSVAEAVGGPHGPGGADSVDGGNGANGGEGGEKSGELGGDGQKGLPEDIPDEDLAKRQDFEESSRLFEAGEPALIYADAALPQPLHSLCVVRLRAKYVLAFVAGYGISFQNSDGLGAFSAGEGAQAAEQGYDALERGLQSGQAEAYAQESRIVLLEAQFYDVHVGSTQFAASPPAMKSIDDGPRFAATPTGTDASRFSWRCTAEDALLANGDDVLQSYGHLMLESAWAVVCPDIRVFHQATIGVRGKVTSLSACASQGRDIDLEYPVSDCVVLTDLELELRHAVFGDQGLLSGQSGQPERPAKLEGVPFNRILLAYTTLRPVVSVLRDPFGAQRLSLSATPGLEVRDYLTPTKTEDLLRFRTDLVLGNAWSFSGEGLINGEVFAAELAPNGAYFLATSSGNAAIMDLSFGTRWAALRDAVDSAALERARDLRVPGGVRARLDASRFVCTTLLRDGGVVDPKFRQIFATVSAQKARPDLYALSGGIQQIRTQKEALTRAFNSARQRLGVAGRAGAFGDEEAAIRVGEVMAADSAAKKRPLSVTAAAFADLGQSLILGTSFGHVAMLGLALDDGGSQRGPGESRKQLSVSFCKALKNASWRLNGFRTAKQNLMTWLWHRAGEEGGQSGYSQGYPRGYPPGGAPGYGEFPSWQRLGEVQIRRDEQDPPPFVNVRVTSVAASGFPPPPQDVLDPAGSGGGGSRSSSPVALPQPVLVSYELDREHLWRLGEERAVLLSELGSIAQNGELLQILKNIVGDRVDAALQSGASIALNWEFITTFFAYTQYASEIASSSGDGGGGGGGVAGADQFIDSLLEIPGWRGDQGGYFDGQDDAGLSGELQARRKAAARYSFSATSVEFI